MTKILVQVIFCILVFTDLDEDKLNLLGPTDEAFTEAEEAGIIPDSLDGDTFLLPRKAVWYVY